MGDSADFHFGKQTSGGGLEFVGQKKHSLFAQYTAQFSGSTAPAQQRDQSDQPQAIQQQQTQAVHHQEPDYTTPAVQQTEPYQDPQDYSSLLGADDEVMNDIPSLNIQHNKDSSRRTKGKKLHVDKSEKPSKFKILAGVFAVTAGLAIVAISAMYLINSRPAVSEQLKAQAGFPVYEMMPNGQFSVDKESVEINKNGSLVYVVHQNDNKAKFIVSQQAVPDIVKDETAYQQFLTDTDKFASLESPIGKAFFTKPASIGSDVSVVIKDDKTLMFIRGDGSTSEQDWANLIATIKK